MEVHHHPHVEKKRFKEYFFEFIMIFLAVTLGFFAENIRENISDKRQVNQYAQSMLRDLKTDLEMYHTYDSLNLSYCAIVDTIFNGLENGNGEMGKVYYLARKLTMMGSFVPGINAKTYSQMTSTGGFRLIKHQAIADSIALYYQLVKSFDNWADLQRQRINDLITTNDKVFNARGFFFVYKSVEHNVDPQEIIRQNKFPLISKDPRDINVVLMHHQYFYGFLKLMNRRSDVASAEARRLINLLKKEYSIDNE
ncbi:MAG: hypothetical protein ACHQF0_03280 [Chitinophagales bacterium]